MRKGICKKLSDISQGKQIYISSHHAAKKCSFFINKHSIDKNPEKITKEKVQLLKQQYKKDQIKKRKDELKVER